MFNTKFAPAKKIGLYKAMNLSNSFPALQNAASESVVAAAQAADGSLLSPKANKSKEEAYASEVEIKQDQPVLAAMKRAEPQVRPTPSLAYSCPSQCSL